VGKGGGLMLLVAVTVLALLAAPHAAPALEQGGIGRLLRQATSPLPELSRPESGSRRPSTRAGRAVAFALAQRDKPYRWGAEGPIAFDCSGLTWAAWRSAGVAIPRTAAGQLAGLPRVRGRLQPGDLVIYRTSGPTRRHVAMVVGADRMVEAPRSGVPVRLVGLRPGWLGAVRPTGGP
jgi:cell wall-associated NlpC family hydrolase